MTALVLNEADKKLVQYKAMCRAIAKCNRVDECSDIADKAVALAAYYAQINDIKAEMMLKRIKMRALRRMGELFNEVGLDDLELVGDKLKKLRTTFPKHPALQTMTRQRLSNILSLARLSLKDFKEALNTKYLTGSYRNFFYYLPENKAYRANMQRMMNSPEIRAELEEVRLKDERQEALNIYQEEVAEAADDALNEVGLTLEVKFRLEMKQVVFLIKKEVHAVLRQAAFDNEITMQEVLRQGLRMWLEENGYDFPDSAPTEKNDAKRTEYSTAG